MDIGRKSCDNVFSLSSTEAYYALNIHFQHSYGSCFKTWTRKEILLAKTYAAILFSQIFDVDESLTTGRKTTSWMPPKRFDFRPRLLSCLKSFFILKSQFPRCNKGCMSKGPLPLLVLRYLFLHLPGGCIIERILPEEGDVLLRSLVRGSHSFKLGQLSLVRSHSIWWHSLLLPGHLSLVQLGVTVLK